MIVVLAVAALLSASFAASPASAITELEEVVSCKIKTDRCPENQHWGPNTIVDGEASNSELLSSLGTIKCASWVASGTQTELLVHGSIESVSFSKCALGKSECTVTPEHLNYLVLVLLNTDMAGGYHAVVSSGGSGNPQAHVVCGGLVNCTFGAAEILFSITSLEHDTSWTVNQSLSRTGGICPSTSTWQAAYLVRCLEPANTFVDCFPKMQGEGREPVGAWPETEQDEDVVLCKEDVKEGKCPQAQIVSPTAGLDAELASGTESQLLTSLGTVKCTVSKASGKTTTTSPSQLEAEVTSMSLEKCTVGETSCTVTSEHLSYLLLLLLNEEANYHVVMEEAPGKGKPQFKVVCGSVISCAFGNAETLFSVELGEADVSLKVAQELNRTGSTCPKTSKWEATYLLRALEGGSELGAWPALAVVPNRTFLCKEDAAGGTCPEEKRFGTGTALDAELASGTESLFLSGLGSVKCTTSTIEGQTTTSGEATLEAEFEAMSFSGCTVGETSCTVTPEHLPYRALLLLNEEEEHHVIFEETSGKGKPQFKVVCGSVISCTFGNAETLFSVELGEKDVSLKVAQELNREGSICPKTSKWEATYLLRALES